MRDEQYQKLKVLQEKLVDVVLVEADPASWSGEGKPMKDLPQEDRGDRYWCKKNAAATLTVLMKLVSLTGHIERNTIPAEVVAGGDADLDKEVRQAQREAEKILKKLRDGAKPASGRSN